MTPSHAYRLCEQIVRTRARNFSYGIRLLPVPKRQALSAVYALARRIDDIGDTDGPAERRLDELSDVREDLRRIGPGQTDLVLLALDDAARRYPIPLRAFEELIDGCAADVRGATYQSFDELLGYCRCVAGSVGRLSLGVFGAEDHREAEPLADALGIALQLTNILRDVREDRLTGRVYLPAEDLERFGCTLAVDAGGDFTDPPDRLAALVRHEAARAREWYEEGTRLVRLLDRRSAACAMAMAGIYRSLLDRIAADPASALAARSSLPTWRKTAIAARAVAGARR
ncbi:presqualene diphosphate synthase HpnD [Nonomuraea sp. MCN248]|uniref:Presqualene diphosphate synthase HpnD n=1 Tax=Nonomuraea corallina TaxID=2989783 RepID=A0ABT4SK36_9ACTN|nr:presqualene diphosphate synthase HpnD [Nonomuraea corallina]MDA0637489.1 presqualene diphosphate synthase HpnD [Nonomuraea corallina]